MSRIPSLASERGAVLVQTAAAALVLVGFGTFVIDYGVLWVARHQAQNAADAGAIAGAIARAYDDFDDPPAAGGVADQNASQVAAANLVWGAPATALVRPFALACPPEVGASGRCVGVDVYRNGTNGSSPLPMWFAPVLNIPTGGYGVRATASARVLVSNATNCLRPWAIPDKWTEGAPGPDFQKYALGGALLTPHDDYDPPSSSGPGTGLTFATGNAIPAEAGDLGLSVPTTFYTSPTDPILPGWLVPLDLPGGYAASVTACNGQPVTVGDQITISATPPSAGDFAGLYAQDPFASWNTLSRTIDNSCAPLSCAPPSSLSPRLVAIAVFDVDLFQLRRATPDWTGCPGGTPCVSVVNIVGFFIADSAGSSGYLTSYPGLIPLPTDPLRLTADSSFLKAITLVR